MTDTLAGPSFVPSSVHSVPPLIGLPHGRTVELGGFRLSNGDGYFGRPGSSHVPFGQVSPFPTTEMWLLVQTSDDSTSLQVGLLRGLLQCMARVPFHLPMKVTPGLTLIRHWDGRLSSKASAGLLLCGTAGAAS